ncbi:MAG TPA: hypothetical protein VKH82_00345, partial [Candidatus Binatia bacterium]|nr:hypothetical protein [Candidatus Binatia bacterium]
MVILLGHLGKRQRETTGLGERQHARRIVSVTIERHPSVTDRHRRASINDRLVRDGRRVLPAGEPH